MIKRFLKTVEEEDLFPGTIKLFITQQKDEIKKLNCRKSDPKFVERVLNRFEEGPNGKTVLKSLLKKLINLLKTNGVHNEKDQLVLNEKNLREASKISAAKFEKVIKYGIKASCLKKEERKGKSRIILISEDIQEDENEGNKKIAKLMFKIMKASGVYNEKEQRVCNETIVRSKLKSSDEDFSLALEYCVKEGCLRIYEIKNVKFIILLKEELSGEINVEESNEEMAWRVIKCIKDSKEETEEGYLCMPVSKILERLEINKKRLNEIVKQGEKKELLKFENVNVVYTQERRLQVKNL